MSASAWETPRKPWPVCWRSWPRHLNKTREITGFGRQLKPVIFTMQVLLRGLI
jgi:hypothetical protein